MQELRDCLLQSFDSIGPSKPEAVDLHIFISFPEGFDIVWYDLPEKYKPGGVSVLNQRGTSHALILLL